MTYVVGTWQVKPLLSFRNTAALLGLSLSLSLSLILSLSLSLSLFLQVSFYN